MKLRLGKIVNYHPTPSEMGRMRELPSICNIKEELPAMIVAINDDGSVNLKVMLDGQGGHWAQSVKKGSDTGEWDFYPKHENAEAIIPDEVIPTDVAPLLDEDPAIAEHKVPEDVSALEEVPSDEKSYSEGSSYPEQFEIEKELIEKSNGKKAIQVKA